MSIVPAAVLVKVVVSVLLALPPGAPTAVLTTALPDTVLQLPVARVQPPHETRVSADALLARLALVSSRPDRAYHRARFGAVVPDLPRTVSLRNAWTTGAAHWTAARRHAFATDPGNVRATDADRCAAAIARVTVKWRWSLGVTATERRALGAGLATCPSTLVAPPAVVGWPLATTPRAD